MVNEKSFVVGYDDDEITALVPAKLRLTAQSACNPTCNNYPICGKLVRKLIKYKNRRPLLRINKGLYFYNKKLPT